MPYSVNPQVIINDVTYEDKTINGVTLTNGRNTVDEQPRAGYATINLVTPDNTYPIIGINEKVVVKVDDSDGTDITLWTGWVSDIETTLVNYGVEGWLQEQKIIAVGSLSKLNRRSVGGAGYPKQLDGQRVRDILLETAGVTWATYSPPTDTWADVSPLTAWQDVDILIGNIDTGDFELTAYSSGAASGLALAQNAAASGLGVLYESVDGKITYDDYSSRTDEVALTGFIDIGGDVILTAGLSSVSRLSDLVNQIEIVYKNNQTVTDSDASSIALYGLYGAKVTTLLENQADAEQRASFYMETRAYPRTSLNQLNLVLNLDATTSAQRDALLPMRVGMPIRLTDLPTSIYPNIFIGFVEGYTWTINRNELFLTLTVSEYALSQLEVNWLQVPPSIEWQDVSATLEWQEARVVA
jgi:hypothetical protein